MQKLSLYFNRFLCVFLFLLWFPVAGNSHELDRKNAVVSAIEKIGPAVVNISSEYAIPSPALE